MICGVTEAILGPPDTAVSKPPSERSWPLWLTVPGVIVVKQSNQSTITIHCQPFWWDWNHHMGGSWPLRIWIVMIQVTFHQDL
jgi:hypothetical protein